MKTNNKSSQWGFLRETSADAVKAGIDKDTGLCRTGLEDYLAVIFPNIPNSYWVHDEPLGKINNVYYRIRPDYRCEELKLIIEFDGLQHYQMPDRIINDRKNTQIYESLRYKVVRIPYFIQLTNDVVKQLFGIFVNQQLFDEKYPSMGIGGRNTPAYCCPLGINRMAQDLLAFPQQMKVNLKALEAMKNEELTGYSLIMEAITKMQKEARTSRFKV